MVNIIFTIISFLIFILLSYLDIAKYGSWLGYIFQNVGVVALTFILIKVSKFCKTKSDGLIFSFVSCEIILLLFEVVALIDFICQCFTKIGLNGWQIIDALYSIESSYFFITGWFLLCLFSSLKRVYNTKKITNILLQLRP